MGATHMEKSGSDNMQGDNTGNSNDHSGSFIAAPSSTGSAAPKACSILDPDCEACQ
jgi:ribonucleoside-diphosphate reductase alpha chain